MSSMNESSGNASPNYYVWPQREEPAFEPASVSPPSFDVSASPVQLSASFAPSLMDTTLPTPDASLDLTSQLFPSDQPHFESLYDPTDFNAMLAAQADFGAEVFDPAYYQSKNGVDLSSSKDMMMTPVSPAPTFTVAAARASLRPPPILVPPPVEAPVVQPMQVQAVSRSEKAAVAAPAVAASRASADSKRKRNPPSSNVLEIRKRKHNEVEIRRRQNMNEQFDELLRLTSYERKEKDKDSVLRAVIDKLATYRQRHEDLEVYARSKRAHLNTQASSSKALVTASPVSPSLSISSQEAKAATSLVTTIYQQMAPLTSRINHGLAFTNTSVPMAVGTLHGNLVDANERLQELLGFSVAELRTMSCMTLTHPDDLSNIFAKFNQLLQGTAPAFTSTKRMLNRSGQYIPTQSTTWIVREDGQPRYFFCMCIPTSDILLLPAGTEA